MSVMYDRMERLFTNDDVTWNYVCVCIYIYIIYTHTHTYVHTCTYIYIHTYTHIRTYIHIHTYIHTYVVHIHKQAHTYTRTYTHTYTHTYMHIHTYIHAYIHIHTYVHTYTYTRIRLYNYAILFFQNSTVRSRFAAVCFTTIHFHDPCRVGPSTPDLWCITHNSSVLSLLSALLALFRCACVSSFHILVQFY